MLRAKMKVNGKTIRKPSVMHVACALLLLVCALSSVSSAQEMRRRAVSSLTSEDLLNRPAVYIPHQAPAAPSMAASSSTAMRNVGSTFYRDPKGAFTLVFPNSNWRENSRAGQVYNQRSFRRVEAEGFASATASVYVLTDRANIPLSDLANLSDAGRRELANSFATHFLSSNASLVEVNPLFSRTGAGLRIVADQTIARRVAVRAAINVFELKGRLYVVVCCATPETFDASVREFDAITNSLASSVMRS
jgi:hypothetical protein